VQGPEFVDAHFCEIIILHISSPGLASNKRRDKGGKNDGQSDAPARAFNFPTKASTRATTTRKPGIGSGLKYKMLHFDLLG